MRGSGTEILSRGFPRNEVSMGAEFRGENLLIKISVPEPSLYMCVGWRSMLDFGCSGLGFQDGQTRKND